MAVEEIYIPSEICQTLEYSTGLYPLYIHLAGYYVSYKPWRNIQSTHFSLGKKSEYPRILFSLLKYLLQYSDFKPIDILLLSRYRPEPDIRDTDYLFSRIIKALPPIYQVSLVADDFFGKYNDPKVFNFNVFEFGNIFTLFRSLFSVMKMYLKYGYKKLQQENKKFGKFFSFSYQLYIFLRDRCLKHMFEQLKPEIMVSNWEVLMFKPCLSSSFIFISLQAALVNKRIEEMRKKILSYFPYESYLSDYFLASGSHMQDLVKKKIFVCAKKVKVVGQPRYDVLYDAKQRYSKDAIIIRWGLDHHKKIVLWTTQTHDLSLEENKRNIIAVSRAVQQLDDIQLVIKLHPAEDQGASLYKEYMEFEPIIAGGEADIYSLIYACDLMLSRHSTTVREAALLDRPVVVLNLSGDADSTEYEREGIALGVYRPADLKPAIETLIYSGEQLAKNRKRYIKKYLYKNDGNATQRIVAFIEENLKAIKAKDIMIQKQKH